MNIDESEFRSFVLEGWTVKELQEFYGISRSTVYVYKNKWGLVGLSPNITPKVIDRLEETKKCSSCGKTKSLSDYYSNGHQPNGKKKYKSKCRSCEQEHRYNGQTKKIINILAELGKKYECEVCGYDRNSAAITFHHLDPAEKEFGIAQMSKTISESKLKEEIKKCVVLCHNCHMEEHYPHLNKE
jgi:transcription elongation factor Elf1